MQNTECKMQNAKWRTTKRQSLAISILHFAFCIQYFAFDSCKTELIHLHPENGQDCPFYSNSACRENTRR